MDGGWSHEGPRLERDAGRGSQEPILPSIGAEKLSAFKQSLIAKQQTEGLAVIEKQIPFAIKLCFWNVVSRKEIKELSQTERMCSVPTPKFSLSQIISAFS